ncbi:MAG TPA: HYR domain-containing protein, partial [Bacteroidetes bacterium]|nr:HYR domain-containing protein [Bacteroidota bacterium]
LGYQGGGMSNESTSSPSVTNCTFSGNTAVTFGGGMFNLASSSPSVTNCTFSGNSAAAGGGMGNQTSSSPAVTNCSFNGNTAGNEGGGMFNSFSSSPTVTNCTFSGNSAATGGGMHNQFSSSPTVTNCILWGNGSEINNVNNSNPNVAYSIVQGDYTGPGNLDADPLFVSANDLHLQQCSPAIDAGNDAAVPVSITTDLDGNNRKFEAITGGMMVDMGAYEHQSQLPLPVATCQAATKNLDANGSTITVNAGEIDNMSTATCGPLAFQIDGAASKDFDCADIGNNAVTLTVTDDLGQQSTCMATVTITDGIKPVLSNCPANISQPMDAGQCGAVVTWTAPMASDNCDAGPSLARTQGAASGSLFAAGTTTIKYKATDASGNESLECVFTVTILGDMEKPVLSDCPANISQPMDAGQCGAVVTWTAPTASDNCDAGPSLAQTQGAASGSSFAAGATIIKYKATDASGNESLECVFTVTVQGDAEQPNAQCKGHTAVLDATGMASISVSDIDDSSTDNCGIQSISLDRTNFACSDVGNQSVTLTVTDADNNVSTCTATVIVEDNVAPSANCQDVAISLGSDGTYALAPSEVFLNGSDNCGNVSPASVMPNAFSCQDEGTNTVTLTVDDGHGNTATCTATVTVNEFLSAPSVSTSGETCAGAADGSITVSAPASAGQVGYSIDGGNNFQFTGSFASLAPGVYNVVVKVFGVAAICEKTATAIVAAGTAPTTWYKDLDGDGYTDGLTQTSCSQPIGYVASALPGDCNDNDPNAFPGQIWYRDADNDGYSDGTSQTACLRPAGHKTAAELATVDIDCNDSPATGGSINPGATEVCNGIDDDCDGQVDEGTTGGLTFTGNVAFYTQAAVDAFSQCYSIIDGNLTIAGAGITDLSNLANLIEVTGSVTIQATGLTNLAGLDNLVDIGGTLTIYFNSSLTSLNGLEALTSVGGSLMMYYNFLLDDCCAIYTLLNSGGVAGTVFILYNKTGCNSQTEILAGCNTSSSLLAPPGNGGQAFSTAPAAFEKTGFEIYPNPASNVVNIRLDGRAVSNGLIRVYSLTGKLILEQRLAEGQRRLEIDLRSRGAKDGGYLVSLITDGQIVIRKLMLVN